MVIEAGPDATPCNCGNIGCMEANASSWALPLFARKDPLFPQSLLSRVEPIDYKNLKACADAGDALAKKLLQRSLDCWSANLCNLIVAYDPEVIVLSGGISRMGEDLRRPLQEHIDKYAWTPWGHPQVRLAEKPEASVVLACTSSPWTKLQEILRFSALNLQKPSRRFCEEPRLLRTLQKPGFAFVRIFSCKSRERPAKTMLNSGFFRKIVVFAKVSAIMLLI